MPYVRSAFGGDFYFVTDEEVDDALEYEAKIADLLSDPTDPSGTGSVGAIGGQGTSESGDSPDDNGDASADSGGYGGTTTRSGDTTGKYLETPVLDLSVDEERDPNDYQMDIIRDGDAIL